MPKCTQMISILRLDLVGVVEKLKVTVVSTELFIFLKHKRQVEQGRAGMVALCH